MQKITHFDQTTVRAIELSRKVVEALKPLAEEYGLLVTTGRGNFDSTRIEFPVIFRIADQSEKRVQDKALFEALCGQYGFAPADFGRCFVDRRAIFEIVGINPARPKYALRCKRLKDAKELLYPAETVRALLGPAPASTV